MYRCSLLWVPLTVVFLGDISIARAEQFVFSTLPAGSQVLNIPDEEYQTVFGFTAGQGGLVNTLTVPFHTATIAASAFVDLYSSSEGEPGRVLVSWLAVANSPGVHHLRLVSPTSVRLSANTMYFLSINSDDRPLFAGGSGVTGPILFRGVPLEDGEEAGPWNPLQVSATAAFALSFNETEPVPEPGTMLLVLGGLATLMRKRLARGA